VNWKLSKEDKKANEERKLLLLGLVIVAVVIISVFFVVYYFLESEKNKRTSDEIRLDEFPLELFDQDYDVICEKQNCLIKIGEEMGWSHEIETGKLKFYSNSRELKMFDNNFGNEETRIVNNLEFSEKRFGSSFVVGLDYEEPIVLVWIKEYDLTIFPPVPVIAILPLAYGQIQQYELELREIQNPQDCTKKVVSGASAYIPFTFKIFNDPTEDYKLEIIQQSRSFPITQRTPQVMIFHTNYTDQYNIYFEINYDNARERIVYLEYLSRGALAQTEQEKFNGNRFCMNLIINTVNAPKIPTREEMFGDAYFYFSQIPTLVEGFNRNSLTTSSSITYQWLVMGIVGFALIMLIIQNAQNKKAFSFKMTEVNELIAFASDREDKDQERFDDIKKLQNDIVLNQEKVLNMQKEELKKPEEPEQKSKEQSKPKESALSIAKRSINPKTVLDRIRKPKEQKKTEETEETEVEEPKTTTVLKPKVNLSKMDSLTKEVINRIDSNKADADFNGFSYDDLTRTLEWVNEFINSTNFMKIPEERRNQQLKIQEILHAGAIRKYQKESSTK